MAKLNPKYLSNNIKFFIIASTSLVFLLIISTSVFSFSKKIKQQKQIITTTFLKKARLNYSIQVNLNNFIVNNSISLEKLEDFIDIQNNFLQTNDSINELIKKYSFLIQNVEENSKIENLKINYNKFQNIVYELFNEYKKREINLKNIYRLYNKELDAYQSIIATLKVLKNYNNDTLQKTLESIEKQIKKETLKIIFLVLIFILLEIFLGIYLFYEQIVNPDKIIPVIDDLAEKSISNKIEASPGRVVEHLRKINETNKKILSYISSLINEQFDLSTDEQLSQNVIVESIHTLTLRLKKTQQEIERRRKEEEHKQWVNKGMNIFSTIMRQYSNDIDRLGDELIKNLVKYLNALAGGLFIIEDENNEKYLSLLSAFAYDRKKYYTKRIELGEGIIGTVALDKSTVYLQDIPDNYLEIEAGLGDAPPRTLLVTPLISDDELMGVIEIASFDILEPHQIEFAETVANTIAASIKTVKINARTVALLKESQKKSEELARHEKILRQTMEEVSRAHEVAKRNEIELRGILTAVDQTLMRAEYSPDGTFLNSNTLHKKIMGYEIETMRGKKITEFIPEEEKESFIKMWESVAKGTPHQITAKRQNKQTGATVWLLNQYTPIFDDKGVVTKILYLAIDITEQKLAEETAKQLLKEANKIEIELRGILSGIDRTILRAEYKPDGTFVDANKIHTQILGYDKKKMIGKSILEFVPEEERENFRKFWQEVAEGNPKQITVKRMNKQTGKEIWLLNQYNPVIDEEGNVIKIIYLAIDITEQKLTEERVSALLNEASEKERELTALLSAIDQNLLRAEFDINGILLNSNGEFSVTFDIPADLEKNKISVFDIVREEDKNVVEQKLKNVLKGESQEFTLQYINKLDNKEIWLLTQFTPVLDENSRIEKILFLGSNITEHIQTEIKVSQLLKEATQKENELRNVLSAIDKTILRAEYTPDGTLIDANEIHTEVLGYDKQKFIGKSILEFVSDEEKEEFEKFWEEIKKGESKELTVKRTNKQTGEDIWLINKYNPIFDDNGNVVRILYLAIDITEQKRLEQELMIQERIMNQNMEELFREFQRVEEENIELQKYKQEIEQKFDTDIDKLYNDWLNSFE